MPANMSVGNQLFIHTYEVKAPDKSVWLCRYFTKIPSLVTGKCTGHYRQITRIKNSGHPEPQ